MGIAVLAPVAAAYSSSSSSSSSSYSLAPAPPRRAPSSAHVAAAGLSSWASSFAGSGGVGLAVAAARCPRREGVGGGGALGCKCLFGLGVPELVVIAGVAALVFGPKQLPEVGRNIGKTVKSFQQVAKDFETELKKEPGEGGNQPLPATPTTVSDGEEKSGLETSNTKEST